MAGEFARGAARARGWRHKVAWVLIVRILLSILATMAAVGVGAVSD